MTMDGQSFGERANGPTGQVPSPRHGFRPTDGAQPLANAPDGPSQSEHRTTFMIASSTAPWRRSSTSRSHGRGGSSRPL
jgi:hypothetical protein